MGLIFAEVRRKSKAINSTYSEKKCFGMLDD